MYDISFGRGRRGLDRDERIAGAGVETKHNHFIQADSKRQHDQDD
jgi:hypothetical protein